MADIIKTEWAERTRLNNDWTVTRETGKKRALDLAVVVGGTAALYGLGSLVGEAMDHLPYLKEWIPFAVNYVSGIDVQGNLDGLVGLLGGLYGLGNSRVKLDKETLELKEISFAFSIFKYGQKGGTQP